MISFKKIIAKLTFNDSSSINSNSKYFSYAIFSFIAAALIIFLIIFFNEGIYYLFSFTSKGFKLFLTLYDFPIKILTASVILFGIQLTLARMRQTHKQIEIITDNSRFNNFYKHREEFIKFWGKSLLVSLAYENDRFKKLNSPEAQNADHQAMYNVFYYSSYHSFQPHLNDKYFLVAKKFLDLLYTSKLNIKNYDIINIERSELNDIHQLTYDLKFRRYSDYFVRCDVRNFKNMRKDFYKRTSPNLEEDKIKSAVSNDKNKFISLFFIYWTYIGLSELFSFDGNNDIIGEKFENFENNYEQLAIENNISSKYNTPFED